MLFRAPDALYQTERSSYELTHDIMFGYSFGERLASELTVLHRHRLGRPSDRLSLRFLFEGHWDLVGELLISWNFLGTRPRRRLRHNVAGNSPSPEPGWLPTGD